MHRVEMTKARFIGFLAAGMWLVLAAAPPASADGLARFKKSIEPQIPAGTLTYKSSKGLGDDGFELGDVVITPPPSDPAKGDKPQPISIKTVTVEHLDFDAVDKQQPPLFAKVKFDGITSGSNAGGFDLKQLAGIDNVSADFGIDYKLDADKKLFTLKRMELNLNGLAKLETTVVVDGVTADDTTKPDQAMADASLKTADLTYDDHSLLAKALPIAAAMQGTDPKALVALAIGFLDGARVGQGKPAQKVIDSLVAFVEDYQKPKGPLKIVLNPPAKVSNAQLSDAKTADDMVKLLGIEVSYAGTRSSTPSEAPAAAVEPGSKDVPAKEEDETLDKKKE
jgi:hypothetical protein